MSPIEWETFWQNLGDAFDAYGRKLKGRQTWANVLFTYDFDVASQALVDFVKYSEQPPRPNHILSEIKKILNSCKESTTVESEGDGLREAPEIVKRAYMTWMRKNLGIDPPIPGTSSIEPLPLEEAMRVMKKSAESVGLAHLLPDDVKKLNI